MSTDLYETLEIQKDATPDQVRRAYKKRALQTHPDRAPPSDKTQAEERFRRVNNAYEVLIDPQKRESYNRHGVWPPPTEDPRHHSQDNTRDHQFHPNIFTFTDPFELFESFFSHTNPLHDPFLFGHPRTFHDPFALASFSFPMVGPFIPFDPSFGMSGGPFQDVFPHNPLMPPMMGGSRFHSHGTRNGGRSASHLSAPPHSANRIASDRQWVSESHSISTFNGLTTRVHERVDSSGNVHTTTTHPDGNQTHTINGIPQASGQIGGLPPPPYAPRLTEHPRRSYHHRRRHNDYSQGRYDPHNTHRDHDGDSFPYYRDPRRPNT